MQIPQISNSESDKIKILAQEPLAGQEYKESPIITFARKYEEILVNEVIPQLQPFDNERKQKLGFALCCTAFFVIVAILLIVFLYNSEGAIKLAIGSIALAFFVWKTIKKNFEIKLKNKIMPKLMKSFPNFYWQETPSISTEEINSIRIFPKSVQASKSFDDSFCGKYLGVDIDICECEYNIKQGKSSITIFNGVIVRLKMNKKFTGITIIRPKNSYQHCQDLKQLQLEEIKLEDIEFCKNYRVFSTDQIESRYLLTTAFIERFQNMNLNFFAKNAFCVFYNNYVYIAPATNIDLFNLFGLTKNVTDREQFDIMFRQIYSILSLVDYFKLDKKLGL